MFECGASCAENFNYFRNESAQNLIISEITSFSFPFWDGEMCRFPVLLRHGQFKMFHHLRMKMFNFDDSVFLSIWMDGSDVDLGRARWNGCCPLDLGWLARP